MRMTHREDSNACLREGSFKQAPIRPHLLLPPPGKVVIYSQTSPTGRPQQVLVKTLQPQGQSKLEQMGLPHQKGNTRRGRRQEKGFQG